MLKTFLIDLKVLAEKFCFSLDSGNEHEDSQDEIMFL